MENSQVNGGAGGRRGAHRMAAVYVLMALVLAYTPFLSKPGTALEPGGPEVVQQPDTHGCNGVRSTPGSENTDKRLIGGTLVPGGTAIFEITYPVDMKDVGRETFVIDDCVYIDAGAGPVAVARYKVSFVPNEQFFILSFTLRIPADAPVGGEYCNYAKTTAAPSESQASNRKAGPACFVIGGDLRVLKVDEAGASLAGATFSVECLPTSSLLPMVIEGSPRTSFTGVVDDGVVSIAGPYGSRCTITELAAPAGYTLADPATVVAVIGVDGPDIVFVNPRATGNLVVAKVTSGGTGTFTFDVDCDGTAFDQAVTVTDTGSATVAGIPTGTPCAVTERADALFSSVVVPGDGTVTIAAGDNTVAFANTRLTGNLVVAKVTGGGTGTFTFDVDCDGTAFDQAVTVTDTGSATVAGIPTGTACTVTERADALFSSVVVPGDGTVTIAAGDNTVAFANTRLTGALVIEKATDGGTGTFTFTVDCDGTVFDQTVTITGSGTVTIPGIPTGTACTVTEAVDPQYTTVVVPTTGAVTIGLGTNPVRFTNTLRPPSLQITKVADATSVTGGAAIGFTVTVVNAGTGPAFNASLSDPLPAGTAIGWSVSPAYPGPGTCSVAGTAPTQSLDCSFGTLAPGATASVHVASPTSAATSGTFVNTATARADNNPAVSATASVAVTPPPAVVLSLEVERPAPLPAPLPIAAAELPRTGIDTLRIVQFGIALLGFGGLLVWAARRRGACRPV